MAIFNSKLLNYQRVPPILGHLHFDGEAIVAFDFGICYYLVALSLETVNFSIENLRRTEQVTIVPVNDGCELTDMIVII